MHKRLDEPSALSEQHPTPQGERPKDIGYGNSDAISVR